MAEGDEAASTSSGREAPLVCEGCKSKPSKYKCPGCAVRSCSLTCVNAHKQRSGCTGKRKQTQFVPLSQFNDSLILSDYKLLEEVKRVADSAQRLRKKLCPYTYAYLRLPSHLKSLRGAASSRRTKILFLPNGMTRREKNQTRYDRREKTIFWTIEWRFNSTDIVLVDHGVNENTRLSSILANHLQPGPWKHQLQKFCEEQPDSLKLFVRTYPKGATSPFRELNAELPIRQLFSNLVVLEYPVIHVFLPSQIPNFEIVKDVNQSSRNPELKTSTNNDRGSHEGVRFKVEEIEDDDSFPNPQSLDMMLQSTSSLRWDGNDQNAPDAADIYSSGLMEKLEDGSSSQHCSSMVNELGVLKELDFDFEQDLIDTYSNIMAEINPDDFLNWESEFENVIETEERGGLSAAGEIFTVEELEEGEIIE